VLISIAIRAPAQQIMLLSFVFQELYHPENAYLEKLLTAQLTCIDAADRLLSARLIGITSVLECAVSSVGFLWGSATVSRSCGISVGLAGALDSPGQPDMGRPGTAIPDADSRFPGNPASQERFSCLAGSGPGNGLVDKTRTAPPGAGFTINGSANPQVRLANDILAWLAGRSCR